MHISGIVHRLNILHCPTPTHISISINLEIALRDFFIILTVDLAIVTSPLLLSDLIAFSNSESINSNVSLFITHGYSLEKISFGKIISIFSRNEVSFLLPSCNAKSIVSEMVLFSLLSNPEISE